MQWITSNLGTIIAATTAAGFFCGVLANILPKGKAQQVFASLAHLLPANVVGAIKAFAAPPSGGQS